MLSKGHPLIHVTGTAPVRLDGFQLKNVVFDGMTVEYNGGPLVMDNVYFVNCKFTVKPSPDGSLFAESVLQHVPTSWDHS